MAASRIAFLGLGAMGEPMASHLLAKGYAVKVAKHRRPDAPERLQAQGAVVVDSAAQAATESDVIILSLPTSREVEGVVLGENGVLGAAAPGSVIVDCSTSAPASTARLVAAAKDRKVGFVAAGMTRGVVGAKQGKLAFFIGGEPADVETAKTVLQATGDTFVEFDTAVQAHTAKLISNVLSYCTVALVNEALMLGAKSGLDLDKLYAALSEGAPSKALEAFGSRIVSSQYEPRRVPIRQACADMVMMQQLADATSSPMFLMSTAQEIYRLLSARGQGEDDLSRIAAIWRMGEG